MLGAAASGPKLRLREFTFARCAAGRLRGRLREFFLGSCAIGVAASGPKLRLREFTFARCALGQLRQPLRKFFLGWLCWGQLQGVRHSDCASLCSLAVPLGGCANACVSFFLALCARGGCKRSEAAIARIYVCSLPLGGCANACVSFCWLGVVGVAASGRKLRLCEFRFARCAVGRLRERFFLARCARDGCKRSKDAIARIYVRLLCRWAVAGKLVWIILGSLC